MINPTPVTPARVTYGETGSIERALPNDSWFVTPDGSRFQAHEASISGTVAQSYRGTTPAMGDDPSEWSAEVDAVVVLDDDGGEWEVRDRRWDEWAEEWLLEAEA